MANGSVYVDASFRSEEQQVLTVGRAYMGQNDVLNPTDVGLQYIKGVFFTPQQAPPLTFLRARRQFYIMQGSLGSIGQPTNYVRVTTALVKGTGFVPVGYPGTLYIGTNTGSIRSMFFAYGH